MQKLESVVATKRSGPPRRHNHLRRLHHWFGLASFLFVLILSVTGIALNHAEKLGLGRTFITSSWLLSWYGVESPPPSSSFSVGLDRVTLLGNRLYLGTREAARSIPALTGAVRYDDLILVATDDSLIFLSADAEVVDRLELAGSLSTAIEGLARPADQLLLRSGTTVFVYDDSTLQVRMSADPAHTIDWIQASPVPPETLVMLNEQYRGTGVSLERLFYDLHSGRLFSLLGVFIMDLVGALLAILSLTGLVLWLRRRDKLTF